jgi:uncharacterized LabA/DUF88 family protein
MTKYAYVLIDFDNIDRNLRTNLSGLETRLYSIISSYATYNNIFLRFYGGWDYNKNDSFSAQNLIPWLHSFPHSINKTVIGAEIVRSLAFENVYLPYTYRKRTKYINFQVDPNMICSHNNTCDLYRINEILKNKKCQKTSCQKYFNSAFLVDEQKLVDTMINTDILYFSLMNYGDIYLISSDDDFIPPIRLMCSIGSNIVVIHTRQAPYSFKPDYTQNYTSQILERNL